MDRNLTEKCRDCSLLYRSTQLVGEMVLLARQYDLGSSAFPQTFTEKIEWIEQVFASS